MSPAPAPVSSPSTAGPDDAATAFSMSEMYSGSTEPPSAPAVRQLALECIAAGEAAMSVRNFLAARGQFARALIVWPGNGDAAIGMATLLLEGKRYAEAAPHIRRLVSPDTMQHARTLHLIARFALETGQTQQAVQVLLHAVMAVMRSTGRLTPALAQASTACALQRRVDPVMAPILLPPELSAGVRRAHALLVLESGLSAHAS